MLRYYRIIITSAAQTTNEEKKMKTTYHVYIFNNDYAQITKKEYDRLIKEASEQGYKVTTHKKENKCFLTITTD